MLPAQCRSLLRILLHTLFLTSLSPPAKALQTVKIDDENGDPITGTKIAYLPDDVWSYGPSCVWCSAKPNTSQVYEGSWHDGWYTPNNPPLTAQVFFTGTAVNVVGILSYGSSGAASDLTFYIDGIQKYHYSQSDIDGNGFVYNYSFFSTSTLESMQHNLTIVNGGNLGQSTSLLLLDYIEYSYDGTASSSNQTSPTNVGGKASSPPSTTPPLASSGTDGVSSQSTSPADGSTNTVPSASSSSKSNLGLIIGSTLGALTSLSIVIMSLILALRSRRRRNESRLLPRPLSESAPSNSVPLSQGRGEKAPLPHSSNSHMDSDRDGDEPSSQNQMVGSDVRSRMIGDVFTLAAEVQRLVGEIGRDGHGNADGGGEGLDEGTARGAGLPPPYS